MSEPISNNSAQQWYVARGGNKLGPYEFATLRNALSNGVLLPSDIVWSPELPDWIPITEAIAIEPAGLGSNNPKRLPEIKTETATVASLELDEVSPPAEQNEDKAGTVPAAASPKDENADVITYPTDDRSQPGIPFRPVKFRTARAVDHDNNRVILLQLQSQEASTLTIVLSREDGIQLGHTLIREGAD
jgi:hypothetical protein